LGGWRREGRVHGAFFLYFPPPFSCGGDSLFFPSEIGVLARFRSLSPGFSPLPPLFFFFLLSLSPCPLLTTQRGFLLQEQINELGPPFPLVSLLFLFFLINNPTCSKLGTAKQTPAHFLQEFAPPLFLPPLLFLFFFFLRPRSLTSRPFSDMKE